MLIAGAGIGGLTAALALAARGIAVEIHEAAPDFTELGAGLQIGPNGTRVLFALGLEHGLRRIARRPRALLLRDAMSGALLARMPLGDAAEARYGAPYLVMARHALHGVLLEAARAEPRIVIRAGQRVESMSIGGEGAPGGNDRGGPGDDDGARAGHFRPLVAADGVHSALRRRLFPDARTMPSGRTALRALARGETGGAALGEDAETVCVWMGPSAHLVHYPLGPDGTINLVAVVADTALPTDAREPIGAAHLAGPFHGWAEGALSLLARGEGWLRWPLYTMPALGAWGRGPVTLLGDAAHPVLPFLASGAVMAIEDAAVLAEEVAHTPRDPARAFRRYEARRIPRVARLSAAVTRMGEIYHMTGLMRAARNLSLAAMPARALLARNDWLYGFRA